MFRRAIASLALLGLSLLGPTSGVAQPAQGPYREQLQRDPGFRMFLRDLKGAIRAGNRDGVLRLIHYPLRVNDSNADGSRPAHRLYRTAAEVRANYGRIFTPAIRRAILAQSYEMLWGNWQGFMIGDGAIWFNRACSNRACRPDGPVRIFVINLGDTGVSR